MRRIVCAVLSLAFIVTLWTFAADAKNDTAAIRKVLDEQVVAWNKGDLKGFMVGYWNSPQLRFFSGDRINEGYQATYDRYQQRYQAEGKEMGQLTFKELTIEKLSTDTTLVRGRWSVQFNKQKPAHGLFTLIMKQLPEGWKIIHDHTSAAEG
jgi:beta-aspartyl-peptidase (threonine type)